MSRYRVSLLLAVAVLAAFWAYSIMNTLIRVFLIDITFVDLGSIFFLGLISGVSAGLALGYWRRSADG